MAELPRRRLILLHRRDSGKGLEVRRRVEKQGHLGKGSVSTWSLGRTLTSASVASASGTSPISSWLVLERLSRCFFCKTNSWKKKK